jgi:uncharacterized protein
VSRLVARAMRWLRALVTAAAGLILLLFVVSWLLGSALSRPLPAIVGPPPMELGADPVKIYSPSGSMLSGWFIRGESGRGVVVLMHGIRSSRLSMLERARFLHRTGYGVLLFDFQGHGESAGEHLTFGALEREDARAAVDYVRTQAPGERVGVIGASLGGAAALLAEPPLAVDAMVLEMVYTTIDKAVANRLALHLGSASAPLAPLLTAQLRWRVGVDPSVLRPVVAAAYVRTPKLFIGAERDQHTTLQDSLDLYHGAADPKELWIVPGASHVDLHAFAVTVYEKRVLAFFARHLSGVSGREPGAKVPSS